MKREIAVQKMVLLIAILWLTGILCRNTGGMEINAHSLPEKGKTVRVAVMNYPLYLQMHEDHSVTGYAYEYLQEIAKYTGWNYEFVEMSLVDAVAAFETGDIDILPGTQYTEERAEVMDFSTDDMGEGGTVLCVLPGDNRYSFNDFAGYDGMRVAALTGSVRIEQLKQRLTQYGVSAQVVEFDSDEESKAALCEGSVDAVMMSTIRCEEAYKIVARINNVSLYFALNKADSSLKSEIDMAMEQIHLEHPYYEAKLEEKYYGRVHKQIALSDVEKEYIKNADAITVAIDGDLKPVEYYDQVTQEYRGIAVDSFQYISEYTGLQFEFVERGTKEAVLEQMESGEVLLIATVSEDINAWGEFPMQVTEPYYQDTITVVMNKGVKNYHIKEQCVAVRKDGLHLEKVAASFGYRDTIWCETLEECVEAVNKGKADVTFVPSYSRERLIRHSYYNNIVSLNLTSVDYQFGIGVYQGADAELLTILNKAILSLDTTTRNKLIVQNVENYQDTDTWRDFMADHILTIVGIGFLLACVIAAVMSHLFMSRRLINQELQKNIEEARFANQSKNDFLSRMSHDMRTPMNAIIGMSEIGIAETKEEGSREYFGKIRLSADLLMGLINDVLDTSKIESNHFALNPIAYSTGDFSRQIESLIMPLCKKKNITFLFSKENCGELSEEYVMLDPLRFEQMMFNLLTNAVKFTPEGGSIELNIKNLERTAEKVRKQFLIRDTGIGMSSDFMKHMYEPFVQEHTSLCERTEGSGLGLAIVKKLVDLMGGTIECTSSPGEGTEFVIDIVFPVCPMPEQTRQEIRAAGSKQYHLSGKKILMCEDHPLNTQIAKKFLEKQGMVVMCTRDGAEGVACFAQSKQGEFDAVLMDIRMPVMDGLTAAAVIRALDREDAKTVPIFAMTANAYEEDREKSRLAGMNEHLAKPIDAQMLYDTLEAYIGEKNA